MSSSNSHPTKKRRLSITDEATAKLETTTIDLPGDTPPQQRRDPSAREEEANTGFDGEMLATILGVELPTATLKQLEDASGGNMERGKLLHHL